MAGFHLGKAWINADDRYEPGAFVTVAEVSQSAEY